MVSDTYSAENVLPPSSEPGAPSAPRTVDVYFDNRNVKPVEPKIKPLVDALNDTLIVKTFSSCQGHYNGTDQKFIDRNFADVRFGLWEGVAETAVDAFLRYIVTVYDGLLTHCHIEAYKKYIPSPNPPDAYNVYVIKIIPNDRFDHPRQKRAFTDGCIEILVSIVRAWIEDKNDMRPPGVFQKYKSRTQPSMAEYIEQLKTKYNADEVNIHYGLPNQTAPGK